MRFLILAILLAFPLMEATLLYQVGQGHGMWVAAWLVLAAIMGVVLIKEARFALMAQLAVALAQGRFSLSPFIDSGRTVLSGLLLIFPGIISDVIALVLLLIPARRSEMDAAYSGGGAIEGEFRRDS